jgi:D-serine deaminase-like pyridoxal phosphate-dependent protein
VTAAADAAVAYPQWQIPTAIDTPALLVDAAQVQRNAEAMAAALRSRGVAFRPHAKTHKSIEVARILLAAGAVGLTCATIGEAQVFADGGIEDLFIAYPVWAGGAKADRLRALADACRLTVGVDSPAGAAALAPALSGTGARVLIELDSGGRRSGVGTAKDAETTAAACVAAGLDVAGVFTHGGHSYAAAGGAAMAADDEVQALAWGAAAVEAAGGRAEVRSAGSTPTALLSARDGVTEERPGTFVFGDRQQVMLGAVDPAAIALVVATTVVSSDGRNRVVVDAGAKTLAKDRHESLDGFGDVVGRPGARITRTYDHHGVIEFPDGDLPRVGDMLLVVPNHVCPVVNLAEELLVVSDGQVVDRWPVDARARNR